MANADDFRPNRCDPRESEFLKEITRLEQHIRNNEKLIQDKDRLLEEYWNTIQSMRLVNRLKRVIMPWRVKNIANINYINAHRWVASSQNRRNTKICIKIPVYNWKVADTWGDYYFGIGLRKALMKLGYEVKIQTLDEWYNGEDKGCEVVLVLRGLSEYIPQNSEPVHLMWNISHPDDIRTEEYDLYDHVFVASELWANEIKGRIGNKVSCLLQCTDPSIFKKAVFPIKSEILFVGNSKGILRPVIRDLLPTAHDLSIYGNDWENIVDSQYLKGRFIKHNKLYRYYSGAKIVLSDHWDDMRTHGFISNRVFDALACNALVISDEVEGINEVLDSSVVTYKSRGELQQKIEDYLKRHVALTNNSRELILKKHTYESRAAEIDEIIIHLLASQSSGAIKN